MKTIATLLVALLIAGCASYDGRGLKPGVSSLDDVTQLMGEPAMRWQEPDGSTMNRLKYDFYNALMIYPEIWKIGPRFPVLFSRFKRWLMISNMALLSFVLINPLNALIVFIGPMVIMLVVLLDNTFQQHSGLSTDNHLLASRNVEHPLYNFTSWNLGYHTAHHMYPGLHWAELPHVHASIRHRIQRCICVKTVDISRTGTCG